MSDNNLPVEQKPQKSILELAADVQEDDLITEPRCKLCNWEHRLQAEQYWESKRRQHSTVVRFCEDRGFKIDDKSVARHMFKHYDAQQKKLAIKDYAEKLQFFGKASADRIHNVDLCRKALIKELLEIGHMADRLTGSEKLKASETVIKLTAAICAVDESEKKFYDDWKPAKLVIEKLTQIVQIEGENAPIETKMLMAKVVDTLYHSVEGVKIDK